MMLEFENQVKNFTGTRRIFLPYFEKSLKVLAKLPKFKAKKYQGTFAARDPKNVGKNLSKKIIYAGVAQESKIMLTIVGDSEIHVLNREYRGVDKPTDVLSFSYFGEERFPGDDVVGEIVISLPTAKKQAKDHGKTLQEELQFLFIHGLLHVFGFDHIKKAERKVMFDLQDKIIGNKSWRKIADEEAEEVY